MQYKCRPDVLMNAILRNYGGRPGEMDEVLSCFFREMGMSTESVKQCTPGGGHARRDSP